jgi:site-specific DNA-methyltransferase (cytosine-N4-specific)
VSSTIYCGDALSLLRTLPDGLARCCVTSPPYWGLRDYGTANWDGGDAACDHRQQLGGESVRSAKQNTSAGSQAIGYRTVCGKCGARRVDQQLGLEATPEQYVERMVEVFREVRRVLADDGTLWLNIGDSYVASAGQSLRGGPPSASSTLEGNGHRGGGPKLHALRGVSSRRATGALKPKDLVGIPWMLAFALRADGWYLRSDIVWHKPNPMPESVRDRPTKAHEYLFLLSKRPAYYYDAEAIKEPRASAHDAGVAGWAAGPGDHSAVGHNREKGDARTFRGGQYVSGNKFENSHATARDSHGNGAPLSPNRNRRSVWTIATQPYPEAHFATFPPALVEPCVLAGSRPGDTVLDPFAGAGTTGLAARRLGRDFVGIELSPEYAELARRRIRYDAPLLNDVRVVEPAS